MSTAATPTPASTLVMNEPGTFTSIIQHAVGPGRTAPFRIRVPLRLAPTSNGPRRSRASLGARSRNPPATKTVGVISA